MTPQDVQQRVIDILQSVLQEAGKTTKLIGLVTALAVWMAQASFLATRVR